MPAVAVRRDRLVLFIINRFKGYLDGNYTLKKRTEWLELCGRRENSKSRDQMF